MKSQSTTKSPDLVNRLIEEAALAVPGSHRDEVARKIAVDVLGSLDIPFEKLADMKYGNNDNAMSQLLKKVGVPLPAQPPRNTKGCFVGADTGDLFLDPFYPTCVLDSELRKTMCGRSDATCKEECVYWRIA